MTDVRVMISAPAGVRRLYGSGFVAARGLAITANHVVRDHAVATIFLETPDGRTLAVERVEGDEGADVALLWLSVAEPSAVEICRATEGAKWIISSRPLGNDAQLTGAIASVDRHIVNDRGHQISVLQLTVDQNLQGFSGYSGSAVRLASVRTEVIGVLCEQLKVRMRGRDGATVPASNVLYAVPMTHVLDLFGLQIPVKDRETLVTTTNALRPQELKADVHGFSGRTGEIDELDRLLPLAGHQPSAVVISAVSGTAGVGKTALALHWAHRVADRFPDGQLYVDLQGYAPGQPMPAGDALAMFLRTLGVDDIHMPHEIAERANRFRTLLAGRRMLVVLDNASSAEQVRHLLPGTPSCLVVVTSRDDLAALVARHGARRINLDLLPLDDAVALLRTLIGKRVETEPAAAATLAEQCVRLPLALRVAAELATARPTTSLAKLVDELADEQRRLRRMSAGDDPHTAVRAVFSWSYRHLSAAAARVFRLLGLHPAPDIDPYATAALASTTLERAEQLLDLLIRAHLVRATTPGRYGMHDLLRAYAASVAAGHDSPDDRQASLTRLFDYYLSTAAEAMDALVPAEQHRRPRIPPATTPTPLVADAASARTWLDAERATLVAVTTHMAAHGWPSHTIQVAATLARYLETGGYYSESVTIQTHASRTARQVGDRVAEAHALTCLGLVYERLDRYQEASDCHHQALTLCREVGDRSVEARALNSVGNVYYREGDLELALDHHRQALDLSHEIGDPLTEASALLNLSNVYERQGQVTLAIDHLQRGLALSREIGAGALEAAGLINLGNIFQRQSQYESAINYLQQALALSRDIGDRRVERSALYILGNVYERQGDCDQAVDHLQQGLTLCQRMADRLGEAICLHNLGNVFFRQARCEEAIEHHESALTLFRQLGDRTTEVDALNEGAEALLAAGLKDLACAKHAAALSLATQIGNRHEQARAHDGLANIHLNAGDVVQARYHWRHALALYTDLGDIKAADVHSHLVALDHPGGGDCEGTSQ